MLDSTISAAAQQLLAEGVPSALVTANDHTFRKPTLDTPFLSSEKGRQLMSDARDGMSDEDSRRAQEHLNDIETDVELQDGKPLSRVSSNNPSDWVADNAILESQTTQTRMQIDTALEKLSKLAERSQNLENKFTQQMEDTMKRKEERRLAAEAEQAMKEKEKELQDKAISEVGNQMMKPSAETTRVKNMYVFPSRSHFLI